MSAAATSANHRDRRKAALAAVQREQILEGFASAISAKGYAATTVTDIVAAAHVSKTTFYDLFLDKEAVFLALHTTVSEAMLAAIARARRESADEADWRARIKRIVAGYLNGMADNPTFMLQVIVEAAATSEATKRARDEVFERFALQLTDLTEEFASTDPGVQPLSNELAIAALAGILELLNRAAPRGADAVRSLAPSAGELLIRLIQPCTS